MAAIRVVVVAIQDGAPLVAVAVRLVEAVVPSAVAASSDVVVVPVVVMVDDEEATNGHVGSG